MNEQIKMIDGFEHPTNYIFPDIRYEMGEIERTAKLFSPDDIQSFMKRFVEQAQKSQLVELTEDLWSVLENTDSFDIAKGDWATVEDHALHVGRDWKSKKEAMEAGKPIHAPIILKYGDIYHKVAGNTRLMISRAEGEVPKVLLVELNYQ